jgi:hypothetical protein
MFDGSLLTPEESGIRRQDQRHCSKASAEMEASCVHRRAQRRYSQKPIYSHQKNGRARKDKISGTAERGCLIKILFAGL